MSTNLHSIAHWVRKVIIFFAIFMTSISLVGCQRFMKGNGSSTQEPVKITPREFQCLSGWGQEVKKYFHDELNDEQTKSLFNCLNGALKVFKTYTKRNNPNEYSENELSRFLNRYLMKDGQLSKSFMSELMKLKVFLVGGTVNAITLEEFEQVHKVIDVFSEEAVNLRGKWKVLLLAADRGKTSVEDIQSAQVTSKKALLRLIGMSYATSSNYTFDDLRLLIEEASNFIKIEETVSNLRNWMSVANAVKVLFVGESSSDRGLNDWYSMANWATDAYSLMSSFYYHVVGADTNQVKVWPQIFSLIDNGLSLIESSPQMQKAEVLTARSIDSLISEIVKVKAFNVNLNALTMQNTYRHILASMIQNKRLGKDAWKQVKGLERQDLTAIRKEYTIWKIAQKSLVDIIGERSFITYDELVKKTLNLKLTMPNHDYDLSWLEWQQLVGAPVPLVLDTNSRLVIPTYATGKTTKLSAMSLMNGLRTIVRLVLTGYGVRRDDNPWTAVMTEQTMKNWEDDFRDFGVEIHFLDKLESGAGPRAFSEAKYFSFSSRGEEMLSSRQMMELLSLMISGGMGASSQIMDLMDKEDCFIDDPNSKPHDDGKKDKLKDRSFDKPIAKELCFDKVVKSNFHSIFANLPALTREIRSNRISINDVLFYGKMISKKKTKKDGTIEYGEIRTMGGVLHYLEALFEIYDKNRNQNFDQDEISSAFPRFAKVVEEKSPLGNTMVEPCYMYIVYKGEIPKANSITDTIFAGIDFLTFYGQMQSHSLGEVPRQNLLKVIAVIKSQ